MTAATTELIRQFKEEATKAGAVVYEARKLDDAVDYVLKLSQKHSVKHVVKSKSAVADQIRLRKRLEMAGIEVVETDLGQWLIQLAEGKPTEQRSLEQLAKLISERIGEKLQPEPQVLLNAACSLLRRSCLFADMGISEADIAIAETGTLVIVSNEGNARLVAVLPHIHMTVVDCKNVVRTMEDAVFWLKSLGRNTPEGKVPSYITYITGRNRTADIPGALLARAQGPADEHIILVNELVSSRGEA